MKNVCISLVVAFVAINALFAQQVGIGIQEPENQLHVLDSVGEDHHVMLIENADPLGSGLKIRIDGSHPTWFPDDSSYVNFLNVVDDEEFLWFDDWIITYYRILFFIEGGNEFGLFDALSDPIELAGMQLDTFALTLHCYAGDQIATTMNGLIPDSLEIGALDYIDLGAALNYSLTLPDLALDNTPTNIPNIPDLPTLASNTWTINVPDPVLDPPGNLGPWTISIPPFDMGPAKLNNALEIPSFNSAIDNANDGIDDLNQTVELSYDTLRIALENLDSSSLEFLPPIWEYQWDNTVALPSFSAPDIIPFYIDSLAFFECPDPNPFSGDISFGFVDYFCTGNTGTGEDSLHSVNHFVTFMDKDDRQLGAISAQSLCEGYMDYWDLATALKLIPTDVSGIFTALGTYAGSLARIDKIGVSYESGHGDYAEWLERLDHSEHIEFGDIVGVQGGKICRTLYGAEQVMVVSRAPIVLGNTPPENRKQFGNNVAFISQVPVKIIGPVHSGDYIAGNLDTPGYGVAVSPESINDYDFNLVIGRSWETNEVPGFKYVNTIVGMHNNAWAAPYRELQDKTNNLEMRLEANERVIQSLADKVESLSLSVSQ